MSQSRLSIIPSAAVADQSLTATQLRVLCAIGSFTGKDRSAYPKQSTIADVIGVSRETVCRAISALSDKGYVEVQQQFRSDGGQMASLYLVRLDPCDAEITPPVTEHEHGDPSVTPPVTSEDHTPCDAYDHTLKTVHKNGLSTSNEVDTPDEIQMAFDAYVKVAARLKAERGDTVWPVNITFTKKRRAALRARIKEHGLPAWGTVLRKASASSFCTGSTGWVSDFNFLTSPDGFLKTLEGNYDDRTAKIHSINGGRSEGRSGISGRGPDSFDRLAERLAGNTAGADAGADAERGGADEGVIDAEFTWAAG